MDGYPEMQEACNKHNCRVDRKRCEWPLVLARIEHGHGVLNCQRKSGYHKCQTHGLLTGCSEDIGRI